MNRLYGKWPGEVASYDGDSRICRVRINGITDGSTDLPEATLCNPLGDDASNTEIRIVVNAPIWIEFEAGDPRFPIIVGYRTPRRGNPTGWRRWRHANMELTADGQMKLNSGASMWLTAGGDLQIAVSGNITYTGAAHKFMGPVDFSAGMKVTGGAEITGPLTNNGTNVGSSHVHQTLGIGADTSTPH